MTIKTAYNEPVRYTAMKVFLLLAIGHLLSRGAYVDMLIEGRVKIDGWGRAKESSLVQEESGNKGQLISSKNSYYLLWKQEGTGCQNWSSDRQNRGGLDYTCMGITQTAWNTYRRNNPSLNLPARVESAYRQLGSSEFKNHATKIYDDQYCRPIDCTNIPSPVREVVIAISANGGPGVARRHLKSTEGMTDPVARAKRIAELEEARYHRIAQRDPSQRQFLRGGWGNNIRERKLFIQRFRSSEKSV